MSRQYFMDTLVDPPLLNPNASAITSTSETGLWPVALFSPIAVGDIKAGKIYKVSAGGIYSTSTSGTLTITPRIGTSTSGITLGASGAQTVPVSVSGAPWYLEFTMVIRTVGLAGTNSTAMGNGFFTGTGTVATAGTALSFAMGGTSATFDASIAQGLFIGWTLSVAGSCTPEWVAFQSLN
jgi:hypothetical protein